MFLQSIRLRNSSSYSSLVPWSTAVYDAVIRFHNIFSFSLWGRFLHPPSPPPKSTPRTTMPSKRLNRHHAASRVAACSRARTGSPPPASFTVLAQTMPRLRPCTWPRCRHQRLRQRARSHACDAAVSARLLCFRWVFDHRGRAYVAIVRRNSKTSASRLPSTFASRHNKRHKRRAGGPGEA